LDLKKYHGKEKKKLEIKIFPFFAVKKMANKKYISKNTVEKCTN